MPRQPRGTRPISTMRRLSVSHSSEPMAMPTENTTSSSEATCSLPCTTSLAMAGEVAQEHGAHEPHPRDAQQRAEHHQAFAGDAQVAPGLGEGVPVDAQAGVAGRRLGQRLGHQAADDGEGQAAPGHVVHAHLGDGDEHAAQDVAQQDGHEGAHLHHAVAAGQLVGAQVLRQVGVLHRAEQGAVQAQQEDAAQHDVARPWRTARSSR